MKLRTLVLALVLIFSAFGVKAGQRLFGFELEKTFAGVTLDGVYDDGSFFSETYFEDGSIRYHDVNGADSGEWTVDGDAFCTFYQSQQGACFFVERDGDNCFTFYEAIEEEGGKFSQNEAWTSRGWNRDSDSTCPTPPGAEI
jgi:hypothetical protein